MLRSITFFEGSNLASFHPLTLTRPVHDLRVGFLTIGEKWLAELNTSGPAKSFLRSELKGLFPATEKLHEKEYAYWILSPQLPTQSVVEQINQLEPGQGLTCNGTLLAALVTADTHNRWIKNGPSADALSTRELQADSCRILHAVWDLLDANGSEIEADIKRSPNRAQRLSKPPVGVQIIGSHPIYVDGEAVIEPGSVLVAEKGPIYIGNNATIMAQSVLRGPVAVCDHATVKVGGFLYEETTIGPHCKVGGEIQNTIFHSYSNKGHSGFTGNSLFGQWVNLGADTNTSNLKNNYSAVRAYHYGKNEQVETGRQFLGTIMGDHSKTAINTMLNTGTVCGVSSNLFASSFPPKQIPSFRWIGDQKNEPYRLDDALDAMEKMMKRRSVLLTDPYIKLMTFLFKKQA
ncbi:MAG: putative sugar nucleotidyl transferase [Balneolaceae bacterium]